MTRDAVRAPWSRWLVLVAALAAPSFCAAPGGGETELIKKDLGQLAREAELVVLANVVSSHAAWDTARRLIWTTTVLEVEASWKGQAPRRIALKELGGVVPPVGMKVHGAPRYSVGERAVVFLKKDALGQWRTHGWTQGRFTVMPVKAGTRLQVDHPHVVAGFFSAARSMGNAPIDLPTFEAKVRALVAATVRRVAPAKKGGQ